MILFPSLLWTLVYYLCREHINILAEPQARAISMCPRPNNRQQSTVNWGIKSLSHNLAYSNCLLYATINVVTSRIIHHTFLPIPKHNKLYHYSSVYIVRLQRAVLGSHHCTECCCRGVQRLSVAVTTVTARSGARPLPGSRHDQDVCPDQVRYRHSCR